MSYLNFDGVYMISERNHYTYKREGKKIQRNDKCLCESCKKYKNCCDLINKEKEIKDELSKEIGFFEMLRFRGNRRRRKIELKFRYHIYKDMKKGIMHV